MGNKSWGTNTIPFKKFWFWGEIQTFLESNKLKSKSFLIDIWYGSRFTERNILRVYPKGTRLDSSNYSPFHGWKHGAQMVAFNMQVCMYVYIYIFFFNYIFTKRISIFFRDMERICGWCKECSEPMVVVDTWRNQSFYVMGTWAFVPMKSRKFWRLIGNLTKRQQF